MYRLLIVDDEPIIADGLYEVLQNVRNLELDICKVYSGKEAVDMINKTRIDIVLSDIRMPEMDGMELFKHIRNRWPECRVIFLTGFHEFEYVYTAIQYDGVSYLLKTEGYDKIISTIKNVVSDIETSLKKDVLAKKAEEYIATTVKLLKDNFLNNILKGRFFAQDINNRQFGELELELSAKQPTVMLVGRIDNLPATLPYSVKSRQMYTVRLIAENFFSSHIRFAYLADEQSNLIWLIQPLECVNENSNSDMELFWNRCLVFIRGSIELIQENCKKALDESVSFAIGNSPTEWLNLPEQYSTLKMVLNYRFGLDSGMLLTDIRVMDEGIKKITELGNDKLFTNRIQYELLAEALEYGKRDDFFVHFNEYTESLKKVKSMHNHSALEQYHSIALIFLSYINRWGIIESIALKTGIYKLMRTEEHKTWNDAVEYLKYVGTILFDIQENDSQKRTQGVIGIMQKHINDNIHVQEEITLIRLADLVHFNPSYLSRLFKQVVGMNLSDYIGEIRIKKAKQLLENRDIKINTVAEMLGYSISTNFTRYFKKATNMTPQEYRDFIIGKNMN